jgi:hypothetical protein
MSGMIPPDERNREELRREIQIGIDQLERGEFIELNGEDELRRFFEEVKEEALRELKAETDSQ